MPRIRSVKPELPLCTELGKCSDQAAFLFVMLPCFADREGRLVDDPGKLKAQIFPYRNADVDILLTELADAKDRKGVALIDRYEAEGEFYIQIVKFTKHQQPHLKESASSIPAPDRHPASTVQAPVEPPCLRNGLGSGLSNGSLSSPSAETGIALEVVEGELVDEAAVPIIPDSRPRKATESQWSALKAAYPRREGGQEYPAARKKLDSLIASGEDYDLIFAGAGAYRTACEKAQKIGTPFVKQMSTWLNRKCYLDEIDVGTPRGGLLNSRDVYLDAMNQVGGTSDAIVRRGT